MIVLVGLAALAGEATAQVSISLTVPANLADAADPTVTLHVHNQTKHAIELDAFHGIPFTYLDKKGTTGFVRDRHATCGNGFAPRRIPPGGYEAFPLWGRNHPGPGRSGRYRVALPYVALVGTKRRATEVVSSGFHLRYGDVSPKTWSNSWRGSAVVLVGMRRDKVNSQGSQSHSSVNLARTFIPGIQRCLVAARRSKPWLRGRFSLVVYRYPRMAKATTYVTASVLGEMSVKRCVEALRAPTRLIGKHTLTFAAPLSVAVRRRVP